MTAVLTEPGGVAVTSGDERLALRDVSCGQCAQCAAGCRLWCLAPKPDGPVLLELDRPTGDTAGQLLPMLTAVAALAEAAVPQTAVVLVLGARFDVLTRLVRLVHAGTVLGTGDAADPELRTRLAALTASGRADVVVTTSEARTAVRAVIRGGLVCLPAAGVSAPSVTELVQREVGLTGATDVAALVRRLGPSVVAKAVLGS